MTPEQRERRRFHRIATDQLVEIEAAGNHCRGAVLDISLRGLLVCCDDGSSMPSPGDEAEARVFLDDQDYCIEVSGTVAHTEGMQLGLHCTQMDLESAARLRRLVELNLADDELLERELSELIRDQDA